MSGSAGIELWLRGVGVLGPGLPGWPAAAAVLREPATWRRVNTVVPAPSRLAANERRRAGTVVKAALAVADEAVAMADADPAHLATVFTSSTGDPANCHALCEALAAADPAARIVSPTRFTNSVHNVPAGYWHIATHSMCASTSLAVYDASFGAGLLEAAVTCHVKGDDVLLVACDVPYPEPLHALRPLPDTMAVALVLSPRSGARPSPRRGPWMLRVSLRNEPAAATLCADAPLEALRGQIPAARALPLLA
ncbi:MAG: beta-ketoacyl synthase chain length factor, partial [Rubrivivax sp.]